MNCLIKDRQQFCTANGKPMEKLFYEKSLETVQKVWNSTLDALAIVQKAGDQVYPAPGRE